MSKGSDKPLEHPLEHKGARIVEAGEGDVGQRIDNFLVKTLKDVPKSRVYKMIRKGEVRVNGGRVKPTRKLALADRVRIPPVHQRRESDPAFIGSRQLENLEAAILHEDDRLIVVNKPAGLAVHGGSGVSFGVIEGLRRIRPKQDLELVHRLDRDTSGCLLVSKRRSTLRALHEQIRAGQLGKSYRAIVHGRWPGTLARIDAPLTKYVSASGERRVRVDSEGKPSLTTYAVKAHAQQATLLDIELHTGRTHQIRVHCLTAGHSVVGDEKYASKEELVQDRSLRITRLCLHAARISIPGEGQPVVYAAPLPADFRDAWRQFDGSAAENG